jgi:hypothetical protein
MKTKLAAILAMTAILLCAPLSLSQQSPQPIKYFGYIGVTSDVDLEKVRAYTNFTYVDGEYGQSITSLLTRINNKGMRAIVDLGKVLWCTQSDTSGPCTPFTGWHLCGNQMSETSYITRWNEWRTQNYSVLNSNYVLAFSVITEPTHLGIPMADVEAAVALVKQTYPQTPTLVAEAALSVNQTTFRVPNNVDWIGIGEYYTHPNLDEQFKQKVTILKQKKQSWQKIAYTLDAFYGPTHTAQGLSVNDMESVAQEWYTIASRDPEAVVLAAFLWGDLSCEGGIGSISLPQNVRSKHAAIGTAILAGKVPAYQGFFERLDCQSLSGWAWDSSQPNTPVSVDIFDGSQKIATVRASEFRQDLVYAGIGNGQHGFSFSLPASLRNGLSHTITVKYSGLNVPIGTSPRSITCTAYYEIVARHSGKCLDVANDSMANGGPVIQWTCGGYTNQQWEVISVGSGYYKFIVRHSGKALDVAGGFMENGTPVHQWDYVGISNQQWKIIDVGSGYSMIIARHSGKALDVEGGSTQNGAQVHQWDFVGSPNHQWKIRLRP